MSGPGPGMGAGAAPMFAQAAQACRDAAGMLSAAIPAGWSGSAAQGYHEAVRRLAWTARQQAANLDAAAAAARRHAAEVEAAGLTMFTGVA